MEKSTMMRHRLLSYSKIESKVSWFDLFFGCFIVCYFSCIYVCAVLSNRVPFHFLENVTDANSFIMRFYRAICYTNPFCLLSFSCSDIFTDTKNCVHTIYWVTYLKYTFNTEHEYGIPIPIQCIHPYIHTPIGGIQKTTKLFSEARTQFTIKSMHVCGIPGILLPPLCRPTKPLKEKGITRKLSYVYYTRIFSLFFGN